MRKLILILMLFGATVAFGQTTLFTEFYCTGTGNNLNAGSTTNDAATFTAASGFFTNNTSATTCTWYKPATDTHLVNVGDWASIYPDASASNCFIGRITATNADTSIQVSLVAKCGNVPASDNAGATSIAVGGAWRGPGTGSLYTNENYFPFGSVMLAMTNAMGNVPRINFRAITYSVTNGIYHNLPGPMQLQGYTSVPGDGGKAIFDGGNPATSYKLYADTTAAIQINYYDMTFQNNGSAGTAAGVTLNANSLLINRVTSHHNKGQGFNLGTVNMTFVECEAFNNGNSGWNGGANFVRCFAHDNTGAGFAGGGVYYACLSVRNTTYGFSISTGLSMAAVNCDAYGNTTAGAGFAGTSGSGYIENCNFLLNGYAISEALGAFTRSGAFINNAVGSGTQANTSGISLSNLATNTAVYFINDTTSYAADTTPYVAVATGNFSITNNASTRNLGRGIFPSNTNSYVGTIGFPDIGAAHTTNSAAAGGEHSHVFAQ